MVDARRVLRVRLAKALRRRGLSVGWTATPLDAIQQVILARETLRLIVLGQLHDREAERALAQLCAEELRHPLVLPLEHLSGAGDYRRADDVATVTQRVAARRLSVDDPLAVAGELA